MGEQRHGTNREETIVSKRTRRSFLLLREIRGRIFGTQFRELFVHEESPYFSI